MGVGKDARSLVDHVRLYGSLLWELITLLLQRWKGRDAIRGVLVT